MAARPSIATSKETPPCPTMVTSFLHLSHAWHMRACSVWGHVRRHAHLTFVFTPHSSDHLVFTKRRYRDAWNRLVLRRISKGHNHSVKIKARLARGVVFRLRPHTRRYARVQTDATD